MGVRRFGLFARVAAGRLTAACSLQVSKTWEQYLRTADLQRDVFAFACRV